MIGSPGAAIAEATLSYLETGDLGSSVKAGATTYITAQAFYRAGNYIQGLQDAGRITNPTYVVPKSTQAIIHAGAGGVAGGINSAITRGNIGLGIVSGGLSGGMGSYFRNYTPFGSEIAGRAIVGGVTGGTVYSLYGRSFGEGFMKGSMTSVSELMFNGGLHPTLSTEYNPMDPYNMKSYPIDSPQTITLEGIQRTDAAWRQLRNDALDAAGCFLIGRCVKPGLLGGPEVGTIITPSGPEGPPSQ
ncbi:MAG: hypothetical protein HZB37_05710 [Planctomycetes bacterium]|nr:hypothetical protein [Planctomycetota bacterium]